MGESTENAGLSLKQTLKIIADYVEIPDAPRRSPSDHEFMFKINAGLEKYLVEGTSKLRRGWVRDYLVENEPNLAKKIEMLELVEAEKIQVPHVEPDNERISIAAPLSGWMALAKYLPSKYKNNIEQTISDFRIEHHEALSDGDFKRARWISWHYRLGLFWSIVTMFFNSLIKTLSVFSR